MLLTARSKEVIRLTIKIWLRKNIYKLPEYTYKWEKSRLSLIKKGEITIDE